MRHRRIGRFLRLPRSPSRIRADVAEELRFDLDMQTCRYIDEGLDADESRERAVREFGDLEGTRHYCEAIDMDIEAEARRSNVIEDLRSDIVVAWRTIRRTPAFAAVVLTTLALGIGANTAVFSVVKRVLIAPLPFRAPDQLYRLYTVPSTVDGDDDKLSAVELTDLAAESRSLAGVTMFGNYGGLTYTDAQTAEPWGTVSVAPNFFDVLGTRPALGRAFVASDFVQGATHVIILGHPLWQRVFGGDPRVVGRTVQLNAMPFTVIGVLPEQFVGPTFTVGALLPLNVDGVMRSPGYSRSRVWRSIVRLRAGVTLEKLRAEIAVLQPRIQARYPEIKNAGAFRPTPLHAAIVGGAGPVLIMVMIGAIVVLVVMCVNIAGLFLSRAAARRRELGVRTALGATRGRLIRQVLTESLLYGMVGGAAGVLLAFALKGAFVNAAGAMLPSLGDVRIDAGVLAFAVAVAIACGLAFGLIPALIATRLDVRDALGDGGSRAASHGRVGARASSALVAAQYAFAVVLIVAAGLLTKTFLVLVRTDLGYTTTTHQVTFMVNLQGRYRDPPSRGAFVRTLIERLHAAPGVAAVGYTAVTPWNGGLSHAGFRIEGRPVDENAVPSIEYATASSELFAATGIPLRMGRVFGHDDRAGSPPVIIISERVARRFWPNINPIGARVRLDTGAPGDTSISREVVGVVADVRPNVTSDVEPTVYVPSEQAEIFGNEFIVRTSGDATAFIATVKQTLHDLEPKLPLILPRTMRDVLAASVKRQQLAMALMGAFAALALVLAALGVYGIMAYAVVARTREFGIRGALGAPRRAILVLVLRQGLSTAVVGVACGLLMAAALSKLLSSMLVGVTAHDALTFVMTPVVLVAVAIAACLLPARSATRVQPVEALRLE